MYAENFVVNCGCDRKVVEEVRELLPHNDGAPILSFTLNHESVDLGCRSGLVVTPQEGESPRKS